jgi:hypothetical protein
MRGIYIPLDRILVITVLAAAVVVEIQYATVGAFPGHCCRQ